MRAGLRRRLGLRAGGRGLAQGLGVRPLGRGAIAGLLKMLLDVAYVGLWLALPLLGVAAIAVGPMQAGDNLTVNGRSGAEAGWLLAALLLGAMLWTGAVLVIVGRLRKVVRTLAAGDPFQPENARRFRLIGLVLALLEVGRVGGVLLLQRLDVGPEGAEADLNLTAWFAVLVVFVLAEVFREGARLRAEAELTI